MVLIMESLHKRYVAISCFLTDDSDKSHVDGPRASESENDASTNTVKAKIKAFETSPHVSLLIIYERSCVWWMDIFFFSL
jgi:hypothetical protein